MIKLHFLVFLRGNCTFLERYQNVKPMIPYLHRDLENLLRSLFLMILPQSVVDPAVGCWSSIDLDEEENFLKLKNIDIGFAADTI